MLALAIVTVRSIIHACILGSYRTIRKSRGNSILLRRASVNRFVVTDSQLKRSIEKVALTNHTMDNSGHFGNCCANGHGTVHSW